MAKFHMSSYKVIDGELKVLPAINACGANNKKAPTAVGNFTYMAHHFPSSVCQNCAKAFNKVKKELEACQ